MGEIRSFIQCGGFGTRLWPLPPLPAQAIHGPERPEGRARADREQVLGEAAGIRFLPARPSTRPAQKAPTPHPTYDRSNMTASRRTSDRLIAVTTSPRPPRLRHDQTRGRDNGQRQPHPGSRLLVEHFGESSSCKCGKEHRRHHEDSSGWHHVALGFILKVHSRVAEQTSAAQESMRIIRRSVAIPHHPHIDDSFK